MVLYSDFSGRLKPLNRRGDKGTTDFLATNSEDLELSAEEYNQLTSWLCRCTGEGQFDRASWEGAWKSLFAFIKSKEVRYVELCRQDHEFQDAVADFLTEALRVCNFTVHDSAVVRYFIDLFRKCGIVVAGNPDQCAEHATFDVLGYSGTNQVVTMRVG